jgi:hypothetical protein
MLRHKFRGDSNRLRLRFFPDWFAGRDAVSLFVYPYVAFLALFQAPPTGIPLAEDCSDLAPVVATLSPSAPAEVRSSVAGYAKTCYAVTVVVNGKPVRGYVLGDGLDAVAEFERQRAAVAASIADVAPAPAEAAAVAPVAKAPAVEKPHYPPFRDFSGIDMKGKAVSAHSLKGKVNLVVFWSPTNKASYADILAVVRLYGQFKGQGVDAVSVSLSGNTPALRDTVDDIHPGFRTVPNGLEIAARYNIDYDNLPRTYVLNENSEVIASGLHGKAIEDLVTKLVAAQ